MDTKLKDLVISCDVANGSDEGSILVGSILVSNSECIR